MQDNVRIEKERKYWDKYAPKYDRGIAKYWEFYSSLVDKISQDVVVGNFKHKLMMTIFKLVAGFPVFHMFSFEELSNLVTESGFIIRNKEIIREMVFPIAYIVAELNQDSGIKK